LRPNAWAVGSHFASSSPSQLSSNACMVQWQYNKTLLRSAQLHSKLPASCTAQCVCPRTRLAHTTVLSSRSHWFDSRSLSSTSLPSAVVAGSPLHPAANDTALLAPLSMLHLHSGIPQAQVAVPPSTRSSFPTAQHKVKLSHHPAHLSCLDDLIAPLVLSRFLPVPA
jgi:hypothetical protein